MQLSLPHSLICVSLIHLLISYIFIDLNSHTVCEYMFQSEVQLTYCGAVLINIIQIEMFYTKPGAL
jgi:hypothetical protein